MKGSIEPTKLRDEDTRVLFICQANENKYSKLRLSSDAFIISVISMYSHKIIFLSLAKIRNRKHPFIPSLILIPE